MELVAVLAVATLLGLLFAPSLVVPKETANKLKCASNLRKIGLAMIQYSNDYKSFPHMQALNTPNLATDVAKVYRTLIHFKYIRKLDVYICPSSEDFQLQLDDAVIKDSRQFQWKSPAASGSNQAPILGPPDPDLFTDPDLLQLSYSYRRNSLAAKDARSDTMIAADKAIKEDFDCCYEAGTGPPPPVGNHTDGFNILYGDGHVDYGFISETAVMVQMAKRIHLGTFDASKPR